MGFIPATLILAGLGVWVVQQQGDQVREQYRIEAAHHVEEQVRGIQFFYAREISVLKALAHASEIRQILAGDDNARRDIVDMFIGLIRLSDIYDQFRLLDLSGREVVRVHRLSDAIGVVPAGQLQDKRKRDYVQQGMILPKGAIYASPLDLNIEHGLVEMPEKPTLRLATAIYDAAGVRQGLLVINVLGLRVLQGELSATSLYGESLLINAGCTYWFDLYHKQGPRALPGMERLGQAYGLPAGWLDALGGSEGQVVNDAGQFSWQFLRPALPEAVAQGSSQPQWKVVSFVPAAVLREAVAKATFRTPFYCALAILLFAVIFWAWSGRYMLHLTAIRQRDLLFDANRNLARGLIRAGEDERNQMAQVLHDEVGQALAAVQMRLVGLAMDCEGEGCDAAARVRGEEIYIGKVLDALRGQLRQLRPPELDALGLRGSLMNMLDEMDRQYALAIDADIDPQLDKLEDGLRIAIYRLVREALSNILRHACASFVRIRLCVKGGWVDVQIEDNGCGFDVTKQATGLGLIGMRERVESFGGSMQVDSAPGEGTKKHLQLPVSFDKGVV